MLNVLRPIVARQVARAALDEIESGEGGKMDRDDAKPSPALDERNDAEKFPSEFANPDTFHTPVWVFIPPRRLPEGAQ